MVTAMAWSGNQCITWTNVDIDICRRTASLGKNVLTHWGRVTHVCVSKLAIIGSGNGLSPGRRQAIIWTYAGILLIGTLGTNVSEILIECHSFSFKKMHIKMSSGKWRPSCLGLNVLMWLITRYRITDLHQHWLGRAIACGLTAPNPNLNYWKTLMLMI